MPLCLWKHDKTLSDCPIPSQEGIGVFAGGAKELFAKLLKRTAFTIFPGHIFLLIRALKAQPVFLTTFSGAQSVFAGRCPVRQRLS
jgi:hypothetical protein